MSGAKDEEPHPTYRANAMKSVTTTTTEIKCTFEFTCSKKWDELDDWTSDSVKYCDDCKHNVYLCKSQEEIDKARELGRCLAIERQETKMYTVGVPFTVSERLVDQLLKEADELYASRRKRNKS